MKSWLHNQMDEGMTETQITELWDSVNPRKPTEAYEGSEPKAVKPKPILKIVQLVAPKPIKKEKRAKL